MSRIDLLLRLYRLSLEPPEQDRLEQLATWLGQRQALICEMELRGPPPGHERGVEQALLALIMDVDRKTQTELARRRRELALLLKRNRGGYA